MSAKLDAAIDSALEHEVAEVVKDIILEQAVSAVYSYPATAPAMSSRRKSDGGLGDRGNLSARVEAGHVLIVEDVAPLQGTDYGIALSDVVEHGLGNYRQPGPRPFLNRSETEAVSPGRRRTPFWPCKARRYQQRLRSAEKVRRPMHFSTDAPHTTDS